jgi:outer membrane protein TolC
MMKSWPLLSMCSLICIGLFSGVQAQSVIEELGQSPFGEQTVVDLKAQDLIHQAIARNAQAIFARLDRALSDDELLRAQSFNQPQLFAELGYTDVRRNTSSNDSLSILVGGNSLFTEQRLETESGVRLRVPTGADLTLSIGGTQREGSNIGNNGEDDTEYSGALSLVLRQPLLRGYGNRLEQWQIEQAEIGQAIAYERLRQQLLRVSSDALTGYWRLYRQQEFTQIQARALENARSIQQETVFQVSAGRQPRSTLLEAEALMLDREIELSDILQQRQTVQSDLKSLLNLDADEYFELTFNILDHPNLDRFEQPAQFSQYVEGLLAQWPGYQIARRTIELERLNALSAVEENRNQLDLNVGLTTNSLSPSRRTAIKDAFDTDTATWFVSLDYRMPLGPNQRKIADVSSAQSRQLQADVELSGIRSNLTNELRARLAQIQEAERSLQFAGRNVALYQQLYEQAVLRFSMGQLPLRQLQEREDELINAQRRYVDATVRYELARVALQLAEGSLFIAYGVTIDNR